MSTATWRSVFTYNKYSQITARALRKSLKESARVDTERRGETALRYQQWEDGKGGQQVHLNPPSDHPPPKSAAV